MIVVTSVRLRLFPTGPRKVRAVGSIVLGGCFQIEHVHIVEREDGTLIVAMPSKYEMGKYHDVAHPITSEFRSAIDRAVMDKFEGLTKTNSHAKVSP
jgi:stage V sporulation protein G